MPLIDQSVFAGLKEMVGADLFDQLIVVFLEEAPGMLAAMQTAVDAGDVDGFRRNAHSLKSNAETFGATELASLARELEVMGREGNLDIGSRLDTIRIACDDASAELRDLQQ